MTFTRIKRMISTIILVGCAILTAKLLTLYSVTHPMLSIETLSHWFQTHTITRLLWHSALALLLYYAWGKKVNRLKHAAPQDKQRLKQYRWWMIGMIFTLDAISYW